eukprot:9496609-Pyramimonas_sp.AAC.1
MKLSGPREATSAPASMALQPCHRRSFWPIASVLDEGAPERQRRASSRGAGAVPGAEGRPVVPRRGSGDAPLTRQEG